MIFALILIIRNKLINEVNIPFRIEVAEIFICALNFSHFNKINKLGKKHYYIKKRRVNEGNE